MAGNGSKSSNGKHATDWGKILTGCVGALILGLQGVNLSELGSVGAGGEKRQALLEQLIVISKDIEKSLDNQGKMLDHDSRSFENQQRILETLTKAIDERRDLLQQNLDELKKQKAGP
jgi:hypothetical protein